jgi:serine/threonine-protein kinase
LLGAVIGNYQIVQKLGEGGMGVVYLGQHTLLGRRAAIKVLLPALSARPDIVNRFFNEARAVTSISDPGIVQVFDFGYHADGSAFIVMEYLEGETVDRRLSRLGKLAPYEALRLCRQIASSLAAAHAQNIIHRDLKPENIFLVRDGEVASGERPKILDFGIAKLSDDHPGKVKTSTGVLMGTPIYMSPEQCRGLAEIDHRSDIYALGCVLFHLMTGRPPFDGEGMGDIIAAHIREPAPAPSSRMSGITPQVDALVLRCLAKAPADRYSTMIELATAIGQVLAYLSSPESPTQYLYAPPGGGPASPSRPGTPAPPPYGSRPGTPAPPPPYGTPGPPQPYSVSRPGALTPTPHPPYPTHPGTPVPAQSYPASASYQGGGAPNARLPSPTTLGSTTGQLGPMPTAPPRPSRLPWLIAGIAVIGAAAAAIVMVSSRGEVSVHEPAVHDAGVAVAPHPSDASTVPAIALDAGIVVALPPDAVTVTPVDAAAPPDAPPIDAGRRHRPPHSGSGAGNRPGSASSPHTGSATPGCDRSIDIDCDGIPDVR